MREGRIGFESESFSSSASLTGDLNGMNIFGSTSTYEMDVTKALRFSEVIYG